MSDKFSKFRNPRRFDCVTNRLPDCPRFFKFAQQMCKSSTHTKANHGAVIVRGGRILSMGFNSVEQRAETNHEYMHAEMHAIISARCDNLKGSKIYVFREDKYGFINNSRPCDKCQKMLKEYGIKRAIYTIDEKTYGVMAI